jgi:nitroreductase
MKNKRLKKFCARSPFLSSLYYALFDDSFNREHQSVLAGLVKYAEKSGFSQKSLLRRSIHRIEKGLTAEIRKEIFAESYIEEAILAFEKELGSSIDKPSLKWANDVLSKYFDTVEKTPRILSAWNHYRTINTSKLKFETKKQFVPQLVDSPEACVVSYDDFKALSHRRRSIRSYQNRKVPREALEKAIEVSLNSPSACNRQPFEFRIFDEPDLLKKVVKLPMGCSTFAEGIPTMIFLVGDLSAYESERDRHLIYIDGGLITMSFVLALETLGLASCIIGWPDIESRERKLKKIIGFKKHQRCVLCIAVGYPNREIEVPYCQKRGLDEVLSYNRKLAENEYSD